MTRAFGKEGYRPQAQRALRCRSDRAIVELALREQLATDPAKPYRPRLTRMDRAFWVLLSRLCPRRREVLSIVQPETVVHWHWRGFRLDWRVPKIQPLREMFPDEHSLQSLMRDDDSIFSQRVAEANGHLGIESKRTAYRSSWQNGIAERWIGSVQHDLLDHVIVIDERHLRRLLREYVEDYNAERVHTRLTDSPLGRPAESRPSSHARVVGLPRVGSLHHRDVWRRAA